MKNNIGQASDHSPKDLLMSGAQDTSKPTCLKENEIPKLRHPFILSAKEKSHYPAVMAFQFGGLLLR
jgi:hypothetical protein